MDAIFYHDGRWLTENPKLIGPMDHAFWMSSVVFDGARSFAGLVPDLDLHCQRLLASAKAMLLEPTKTAEEIEALCVEAVRRFPRDTELYIRPMFFARNGFLVPEPVGGDGLAGPPPELGMGRWPPQRAEPRPPEPRVMIPEPRGAAPERPAKAAPAGPVDVFTEWHPPPPWAWQ